MSDSNSDRTTTDNPSSDADEGVDTDGSGENDSEEGGAAHAAAEAHEKGDRHERQARQIATRAYRAERVKANYANHDPFRLADVIGIQKDQPVLFIQVKTNRFTADDKSHYRTWSRGKIDNEHTIFEVWVRYERKGWEMYRLDPETGEYTMYFKTGTCNPSNVRDEWGETFHRTLEEGINAVVGDSNDE